MMYAKLPWSKVDVDDGEAIEIRDADGEPILCIHCWDGEDGRGRCNEFDEAAAELIICGCNNYEALVEELGNMLSQLCGACKLLNPHHKDCDRCPDTENARKLLRQVKKGE